MKSLIAQSLPALIPLIWSGAISLLVAGLALARRHWLDGKNSAAFLAAQKLEQDTEVALHAVGSDGLPLLEQVKAGKMTPSAFLLKALKNFAGRELVVLKTDGLPVLEQAFLSLLSKKLHVQLAAAPASPPSPAAK